LSAGAGEPGAGSGGSSPSQESARERRYYDKFLAGKKQIYCSPLLRALQTAQLALPEEDGWGSITLLKDARERFRFVFERDCLGTDVGSDIADRATAALQMCYAERAGELPRICQRDVDSRDCEQQWWSEEPETEEQVEARLKTLWRRLLDEDQSDNIVLVTHSNLIKALVMQFGGVGEELDSDCSSPDSLQCEARSAFEEHEDVDDDDNVAAWQVVQSGPEAMRRVKVDRLQNCGVLGLRCVLEAPRLEPDDFEIEGWVDIEAYVKADKDKDKGLDAGFASDSNATTPSAPAAASRAPPAPTPGAAGVGSQRDRFMWRCGETQWVAKDAMLMFDSVLVQ